MSESKVTNLQEIPTTTNTNTIRLPPLLRDLVLPPPPPAPFISTSQTRALLGHQEQYERGRERVRIEDILNEAIELLSYDDFVPTNNNITSEDDNDDRKQYTNTTSNNKRQ